MVEPYRLALEAKKQKLKDVSEQRTLEMGVQETLKIVSQLQKDNTLEFVNSFVSNVLTLVYKKEQHFKIVLEEQKNAVKAKFFILEDGVELEIKKPFVGKGGGKLSIIALSLKLAFMNLRGIKGPIFLDEATKMVDSQALKELNQFLNQYSFDLGTQIFLISHQDMPEGVINLRLSKSGRNTSYVEVQV